MKSFFHCDNCDKDTLEFDISSHCEDCGITYGLYCLDCFYTKGLDMNDLTEYIKTLEKKK